MALSSSRFWIQIQLMFRSLVRTSMVYCEFTSFDEGLGAGMIDRLRRELLQQYLWTQSLILYRCCKLWGGRSIVLVLVYYTTTLPYRRSQSVSIKPQWHVIIGHYSNDEPSAQHNSKWCLPTRHPRDKSDDEYRFVSSVSFITRASHRGMTSIQTICDDALFR